MAKANSLPSRVRNQVFHLNFYRLHLIYFIAVILLSSFILYGSGVDGNSNDEQALFKLRYIDALFLCTSAMTSTGLETVNLNSITAFQQFVLFILILLGNIPFVSIITVVIRRQYFKKYMKEFMDKSEAGRQMVNDIDQAENGEITATNGNAGQDQGHSTQRDGAQQAYQRKAPSSEYSKEQFRRPMLHERGQGGFPLPWQTGAFRQLGARFGRPISSVHDESHRYLSFQPSLDQKVFPSPLRKRSRFTLLTSIRDGFMPSANRRERSWVASNIAL